METSHQKSQNLIECLYFKIPNINYSYKIHYKDQKLFVHGYEKIVELCLKQFPNSVEISEILSFTDPNYIFGNVLFIEETKSYFFTFDYKTNSKTLNFFCHLDLIQEEAFQLQIWKLDYPIYSFCTLPSNKQKIYFEMNDKIHFFEINLSKSDKQEIKYEDFDLKEFVNSAKILENQINLLFTTPNGQSIDFFKISENEKNIYIYSNNFLYKYDFQSNKLLNSSMIKIQTGNQFLFTKDFIIG